MITKKITCTVCPTGCVITVKGDGVRVESIEGNECKRGESFAASEYVCPMRILTSSVKVDGGVKKIVSVRSDKPVPRERFFECMELIKHSKKAAPVREHDVMIADILGTGANIVATSEVEKHNT